MQRMTHTVRRLFGRRLGYVYCDMCGDLFHYGHVRLLQRVHKIARDEGLGLLVGVHSDEMIATYKRTPVMTLLERVEVISAIKGVDRVVVDAPVHITHEFLSMHRIELVVHAHALCEDEKYRAMYAVPRDMGIFRRLEYTNGISTTDIMERIRQRT